MAIEIGKLAVFMGNVTAIEKFMFTYHVHKPLIIKN